MSGSLYFVGICNKPGLQPLDSSTISGKRVDSIISGITKFECIKTNLFDLDEVPKGFCQQAALQEWIDSNDITADDRVVVLGDLVGSCFKKFFPDVKHVVFLKHPSSYALKPKDFPEWKENAISEINKLK